MIWSSRLSSTAPATVSVPPSVFTMTSAGWKATSKREKTSPGSSLICGKVRPCLSTKPWYDSSEPVHATPTKLTWSWYLMLAASTEGASRLQVPQVGDQNQNAVGFPERLAASSSPPPTSGLVNRRISGVSPAGSELPSEPGAATCSAASGTAAASSPAASEPPHAAIARLTTRLRAAIRGGRRDDMA